MRFLKFTLIICFLFIAFSVKAQISKEEELLKQASHSIYIGSYDDALRHCYKALKVNPKNAKGYYYIGNAFWHKGDNLKAIENYNRSTELDPHYLLPYNKKAEIYKKTGKSNLALAEGNEAIRLNPDSTNAYQLRGFIYYEKKEYDLAIQDFTKAISLDPQQREKSAYKAYSYRAYCFKAKGQYNLAIKDCMESIRLKSNQGNAYYTIIPSLVRTQQFSKIEKYEEMHKKQDIYFDKEIDYDTYGKAYNEQRPYSYTLSGLSVPENEFELALITLERGIEEYETGKRKKDSLDYSDVISLKGYIFEKLNRKDEAKELYIESLALNPNQPEVKLALSLLGKSPQVIAKADEPPAAPTIAEKIDNTPPSITITSPAVTRGLKVVLKNRIATVTGEAADESGIFEITVNGKEANVGASGNFSVNIPLAIGDNQLTVTATDAKMNKGSFNFIINRQPEEIIQAVETPIIVVNPAEVKPDGKYYALIIGIQDYADESINDLDEPLADATNLYNSLLNNYTFEKENVVLLKNPKRIDMFRSLESLSRKVKETDNLLIFYAGHGYWDASRNQGYWFPSDAGREDRSSWLTNADLKEYISSIKSKHTLLISDACFSGGIFKSRAIMMGASRAIRELYDLPSRKAMTSGTLKEVPDKSVFLEYLTKRLNQNIEKYLSAEQLFSSFRTAVINNSSNGQVPQFGEIKEAGDEGGDFIFIRR